MAIGSDIGLLFRIRGNSDEVVKAIRDTKSEADTLTSTSSGLTDAFNATTAASAIFATGVLAVASAAVTTTVALFNLTKETASYGAEIFDATQKTGLSANAVSALKYEAEQSGSSFEKITGSVAKFNVLLGEANQGNEKAQATLKLYGITATDVDGALKQAITTIDNMTTADQKAAAAKALFKDRAGEIIPVITGMNGSLDQSINRVNELGIAFDDRAARAADELDDTLGDLDNQVRGLAMSLGIALLPAVQRVAGASREWLINNQNEVRQWAENTGAFIYRIISIYGEFADGLARLEAGTHRFATAYRILNNIIITGTPPLQVAVMLWERFAKAAGVIAEKGRIELGATAAIGAEVVTPTPQIPGSPGRADNSAGRIAREAEQEARREAQARLQIEKETLQTIEEQFGLTIDKLRTKLSEFRDSGGFMAALKEEAKLFTDNLEASLVVIEKIERELLGSKATQSEIALLDLNQEKRRQELKKKGDTEDLKNKELFKKIQAEIFKEQDAAAAARWDAMVREYELQQKQIEAEKERNDEFRKRQLEDLDRIGGPPEVAVDNRSQFERLLEDFEGNDAAIASITALQTAFEGLGQAIGSVVQAWILYGSAGQSVRQVTAQILAGVAAQAAVKAVFELAEGFAALARAFFGNPAAAAEAAMHFKSAAIYGTVAGIAAIAGRGIAGNSFQRQTNQATGQSSQEANRNVAGQGQAFSSQQPGINEQGINRPAPITHTVRLVLETNGVVRALQEDVKNNGPSRGLIIETAGI